jgi:hypothetical protein
MNSPSVSARVIPWSGTTISGSGERTWYCRAPKKRLFGLKRPASRFRDTHIHGHLASAYALKGQTERAAAELAEARKQSGDDRYSSIARLKAVGYWGVPKIRALIEATYFAGLRKAGMPEE